MRLINEGELVRIRPVQKEDFGIILKWQSSVEALGGFNSPAISSQEGMLKNFS